MSLYLKHRPQTLDAVYGNEATIQTLRGLLAGEAPPQVYLIQGPTGCGKTTLARIVAHELGVQGRDFIEIDSASFRGIDTVREIRRWMHLQPMEGKRRLWLIDEVHKMTNEAQNAFLKALEDTPAHVCFILATTDPKKLLPTIRGRCSTVTMKPLEGDVMLRLLRHVTKAEGGRVSKVVLETIARDAEGRPRDALQVLEQVLAVAPEEQQATAERAARMEHQTQELARALINGSGWKKIAGIIADIKTKEDEEQVRRAVLGYCQAVLLKGEAPQAAAVMYEFLEPFYNTGWPGLTFACWAATHQ